MKLNCQKCHAGEHALNWYVEQLENGVRIQVVKCICGWQISRPEPSRALLEKTTKTPARAVPQPPQTARKLYPRHPCTRVGCSGTYAACARTKFNLCPNCSEKIQYWKKRGMRTPPPLIQINGKWYAPEEDQGENV